MTSGDRGHCGRRQNGALTFSLFDEKLGRISIGSVGKKASRLDARALTTNSISAAAVTVVVVAGASWPPCEAKCEGGTSSFGSDTVCASVRVECEHRPSMAGGRYRRDEIGKKREPEKAVCGDTCYGRRRVSFIEGLRAPSARSFLSEVLAWTAPRPFVGLPSAASYFLSCAQGFLALTKRGDGNRRSASSRRTGTLRAEFPETARMPIMGTIPTLSSAGLNIQ